MKTIIFSIFVCITHVISRGTGPLEFAEGFKPYEPDEFLKDKFENSLFNRYDGDDILLYVGKNSSACKQNLESFCQGLEKAYSEVGEGLKVLGQGFKDICDNKETKCGDFDNKLKEKCAYFSMEDHKDSQDIKSKRDSRSLNESTLDCFFDRIKCFFLEEQCGINATEYCAQMRVKCNKKFRSELVDVNLTSALIDYVNHTDALEKVKDYCNKNGQDSDEMVGRCLYPRDILAWLKNLISGDFDLESYTVKDFPLFYYLGWTDDVMNYHAYASQFPDDILAYMIEHNNSSKSFDGKCYDVFRNCTDLKDFGPAKDLCSGRKGREHGKRRCKGLRFRLDGGSLNLFGTLSEYLKNKKFLNTSHMSYPSLPVNKLTRFNCRILMSRCFYSNGYGPDGINIQCENLREACERNAREGAANTYAEAYLRTFFRGTQGENSCMEGLGDVFPRLLNTTVELWDLATHPKNTCDKINDLLERRCADIRNRLYVHKPSASDCNETERRLELYEDICESFYLTQKDAFLKRCRSS